MPHQKIHVLERSTSLRTGGQQIDVKAQGLPILRKLDLMERIKAVCVDETGLAFVDTNGKTVAQFGINDPEHGGYGLTNEYEIMRGDLVRVLYEASLEKRAEVDKAGKGMGGELRYEFGTTVTELRQLDDDSEDKADSESKGVEVKLSTGETRRYDLVVAADGQGSRTRCLVFGEAANAAALRPLGLHAAYYSAPKLAGEAGLAKAYNAPESRMMMTRTGTNRDITQLYLFTMKGHEKLKAASKEPLAKQKEVWAAQFADAGWQADRFLSDMQSTDDFYATEILQVKMDTLYKGHVVLLGDAGYCPSPFTGMGTTLALIGAYVLAGELARAKEEDDGGVEKALRRYNEKMREPIKECQKLPGVAFSVMMPKSRLGVWLLQNMAWAFSVLKVEKWMQRWLPADMGRDGWKVPEYPELGLPGEA